MATMGRRLPRMSKSALREKRGQIICESWKIVRGDTVMITTGKDKGLTGTVTKVSIMLLLLLLGAPAAAAAACGRPPPPTPFHPPTCCTDLGAMSSDGSERSHGR